VDLARAVSSAPHIELAGLRALARSLRVGTIPADVWVDQHNLVRRLRVSLRLPTGRGGRSSARIVQTLDFYDFGVPVRVSAPPADKVAKIGPIFSHLNPDSPPPVSGTLSSDQAAAVGRVVRAFWTAMGHDNVDAAARAILPEQRGCFRAMNRYLPLTVTSLRIVAVRPAGSDKATVLYNIRASEHGQVVRALRHRPGHPQWLVANEVNGHWYLNVAGSASLAFASGCP
jgi:hypothetical protein